MGFLPAMVKVVVGSSILLVAGATPQLNGTMGSWPNVKFTHCGDGNSCGGHQHCNNLEFAISDANIWRSLGLEATTGGWDTCPEQNWRDCCHGSQSGVCSNSPSCPL